MKDEKGNLLLAVVCALAAGLFLVDLLTPLGAVVEMAYAVLVLIALWSPRRQDTYFTAAVCTAFTLLGLLLSPHGSSFGVELLNRLLAVFLIGATMVLGLAVRRTTQLVEANARLQEEIRERQRTEERVREQAALLDQVPDAVVVRDLEDRVCYWSCGAQRLYGWTAAEALGRDANELLFRDHPHQLREVQQAVSERGEWDGEIRQADKDGREIVCETRWVLLRDGQGHPKAKLVVNTDVTAKKRLEAQFLRTQRLESIGTLAGGIAHDFNNLLAPILMAAKLLELDPSAAKRQRLLAIVQAGAERGAEMVKQLLTFAGGDGGQAEVLRPADLIREVWVILEHTLPKAIRLEATAADDLWPVRGDATQLSQVLMNLCINARDAMPAGGRLTITATNAVLNEHDARLHADVSPGPHVLIAVADTGTGIPTDVLDKVFDPFFTTKEYGKGTGLGLSTALGIVKSHGGSIGVASAAGQGTQFVIRLPALTEVKAGPPEPDRPELPAGNGELILVVDDEPFIRETLKATLESRGYRVHTAREGGEALAVYRQNRDSVQAVLLDLMMPGMDGQATLDALHEQDPDLRVIVTSGLRATGRIAQAVAAGQLSFLRKPYLDGQVLATLAKVLRPK